MRGSVCLTEIQFKPKISLGEQECEATRNQTLFTRARLGCVCDPLSVQRITNSYHRAWRIYSQQLQANVHHVNCSHKSISTCSFSKDVYVLVWSLFHYVVHFLFLGIYLSELKHNLKTTRISHSLILLQLITASHSLADKIQEKINRKYNEYGAQDKQRLYCKGRLLNE